MLWDQQSLSRELFSCKSACRTSTGIGFFREEKWGVTRPIKICWSAEQRNARPPTVSHPGTWVRIGGPPRKVGRLTIDGEKQRVLVGSERNKDGLTGKPVSEMKQKKASKNGPSNYDMLFGHVKADSVTIRRNYLMMTALTNAVFGGCEDLSKIIHQGYTFWNVEKTREIFYWIGLEKAEEELLRRNNCSVESSCITFSFTKNHEPWLIGASFAQHSGWRSIQKQTEKSFSLNVLNVSNIFLWK